MPEQLLSAISRLHLRRSILFVGAGFSKDATNILGRSMLLGSELAHYLATELEEDTGTDLETISGLFIETFGRQRLLNVIQHEFRCADASKAQKTILSLPWKRIYTTNYDDVVEKCLGDLKIDFQVVTRTDRVSKIDDDKLTCVHLNGYIHSINENNFDDEILLTDFQYFTNSLMQSAWSTKLRTDFHIARSVFFVGYSMTDFEISKILFESGIAGTRSFFIQKENLPRPQKNKLKRFGEVHSMGLELFAQHVAQTEPVREPLLSEGFLVNFKEIKPEDFESTSPNADDAYALFFRGDIRRQCLVYDLANGTDLYRASRHQMEDVSELLSGSPCTIFIHADIGNGKKVFAEELIERAIANERRCFRFEPLSSDLFDDISFLENLSKKCPILLYISDYYSYERMVDSLRAALPNVNILTTSSSAARELRSRLPRIAGENYFEIELNRLDDADIEKLDNVIASYGYWGELAGMSSLSRQRFVKERCARSLRSVILTLFDQKAIRSQIAEVFSKAESDSATSFSGFVKVLALGASGYQPSFKEVCEILGVTFANRFMSRDGGWTSEFFEQRNGRQIVKSSIFAQYLLRNFVSDRVIMDHLVDLAEDLDNKSKGNPLLRKLRTFPLRFSFIERLLDDEGKRAKLVEYYETVRLRGIGRSNPQFWLQYAIARMSFKDYRNAGIYFQTAFALSDRMSHYDDYQIKNHYARYLLESSIERANDIDPVDVFSEAHEILVNQIEGKSEGHYPYRVAQKYLDFIEAKETSFDQENIAKFDAACKQILDFIGGLSREMRKDKYVRRCQERLIVARDVVSDLL